MKHRTIAVVEARMGSSRLPGKSLRSLGGVPLVVRVVERIRRAKRLDDVVIATSSSPKDDVLVDTVERAGIRVHRGSEDDVLGRILGAARAENASVHVQCWGDCPFADAEEVDRVVDELVRSGADVAGNGLRQPRTLPYGLDVIALRVEALETAERETRELPYHREHGTTFLYQNPERFRVAHVATPNELAEPSLDLTINTEVDFAFVTRVYETLLPQFPDLGARDVVAALRQDPTLRRAPENERTAAP